MKLEKVNTSKNTFEKSPKKWSRGGSLAGLLFISCLATNLAGCAPDLKVGDNVTIAKKTMVIKNFNEPAVNKNGCRIENDTDTYVITDFSLVQILDEMRVAEVTIINPEETTSICKSGWVNVNKLTPQPNE